MKIIFTTAMVFLAFHHLSAKYPRKQSPTCANCTNTTSDPQCAINCADPNRSEYRTFSNQCELKNENNCNKTDYRVVDPGNCNGTDSSTCSDNPNATVCVFNSTANNRQNLGNICLVKAYQICDNINLTYPYNGTCCPGIFCPRMNSEIPVCAYNKTGDTNDTFSTNCTLESANECPRGNFPRNNYVFLYNGDCSCNGNCSSP